MKTFIKSALVLSLLMLSISVFSQTQKVLENGTIYWGAFDMDKLQLVDGSLEKNADLIQLKIVDDDYFVYYQDLEGKKFRSKFSKIVNEENSFNKYLDEYQNEYYIFESGKNLYLINLKPLPRMRNKYMMLVIKFD